MTGIICERCKQEIKNPFDQVPIGEYELFESVGGYRAVTLCDSCRRTLTEMAKAFLNGKEE